MTEDAVVGWQHQLNGHKFEQAPGVGDGQGSPACCSPWGCKQSHTTEQLDWLTLQLMRLNSVFALLSYMKSHVMLYCKIS